MATLQDFKNIFQDQVHDFAGDDRLDEMCDTVDTIEILARQEERERIISVLTSQRSIIRVCRVDADGERPMVTTQALRSILNPPAPEE